MVEKIMDWLCVALVLFGAVLIVLLCAASVSDSNSKSEFYSECITTDYDKFQCYSMIYGDK